MATSQNLRTNQDLFSEHYIHNCLPETEEWEQVSENELQAAYENLAELWNRVRSMVSKRNELQLEENFIRPIFLELGIPFNIPEFTDNTQRRPDYVFFETEDVARNAFDQQKRHGDVYKNAIAVADVVRWGQSLDTRGTDNDRSAFQGSSYRMHVHLQEVPTKWGVLTNGKKWRLYYAPTSHRLDSYYEVDLPAILEKGNLEDFKYFYLFFRREAFLEDNAGQGFLNHIYNKPDISVRRSGEEIQDGIVETHLQLGSRYLICSMYENRYAVSWEAAIGLSAFLDIESPLDPEQQSVEVFFEETSDESAERKQGMLAEIYEDDRFPDRCRFLAIDYGGHEVTWEDEGTHTDDKELTVAVEGYDTRPFESTFFCSLDDEFSKSKIEEMLGRLSESINMESPRNNSESGDDV